MHLPRAHEPRRRKKEAKEVPADADRYRSGESGSRGGSEEWVRRGLQSIRAAFGRVEASC
jgi:hypothetical protein